MTTSEQPATLYINGETVPGLERAYLTVFGHETVSGRVKVAETNRDLSMEDFHDDQDTIVVLGEESFVRDVSLRGKSEPETCLILLE